MMQALTSTLVTPAAARASAAARPAARVPGAATFSQSSASRFGSQRATQRGGSVAAHAKKGKKGGKKAAEPEPEAVLAPVDEDAAEGADGTAQLLEGADAADTDGGEGGEVREMGDASKLLPGAQYGDEEEVEEEASAFSTAVGTVKESLANPAVKNLGVLGLSVLAGSFALSCYKVYMKAGGWDRARIGGEEDEGFFPESSFFLAKVFPHFASVR
jgi:hypothetical protein